MYLWWWINIFLMYMSLVFGISFIVVVEYFFFQILYAIQVSKNYNHSFNPFLSFGNVEYWFWSPKMYLKLLSVVQKCLLIRFIWLFVLYYPCHASFISYWCLVDCLVLEMKFLTVRFRSFIPILNRFWSILLLLQYYHHNTIDIHYWNGLK